jgi:hypothetical protein
MDLNIRVLRIIELTSIYWLALFFIGPIISVVRVGSTGAWSWISSAKLFAPYL